MRSQDSTRPCILSGSKQPEYSAFIRVFLLNAVAGKVADENGETEPKP